MSCIRGLLCGALLCSLVAAGAFAQMSSISTVSAASYQAAVAPSSLAAIFGSGLAATTASAALDASGQLPTQLAGTTVEVNGEASPLIYVSPSQINFVIPDDTTTGSADILVRTAIGSALRGTVQVSDTAPGLFSLDASGKGPGAILNAVTYAPAPFLVETPEINGADKRTRLAVYATGIRYAGNPAHDPNGQVTVLAHDVAGNPYQVEYAGAAPGFFGLDQLNIVLPPEIDGAGVVSLIVSTDGGSSNTVTFQVNSLPASAIHLAGLTLSSTSVTAGDTVQATVSLNGRAPVGGITVSLQSSNSAAQVPFSLSVPQSQASTKFTFGTMSVNSTQTVTITARASNVSQTAVVEIDPANAVQLQSFTVDASSIQGGHNLSVTATLSASAGLGGVSIPLSSDNTAIKVPPTLKVPFGQQLATISVPTSIVASTQIVHLTATFGHAMPTVAITLNPPFTLSLSSDFVTGGSSVGGTFTLSELPASASSLNLKASDPSAQVQPVSLVIPAGQETASFTVTTTPVATSKTVSISAVSSLYSGFTQTASLTVNPPGSTQLQTVTITPSIVTGGQMAAGQVTLNAPAPLSGVPVTMKTSDLQHAQIVQPFVVVQSGQTTASFTITTSPVIATETVTITATAAGVSKSAVLKIQ